MRKMFFFFFIILGFYRAPNFVTVEVNDRITLLVDPEIIESKIDTLFKCRFKIFCSEIKKQLIEKTTEFEGFLPGAISLTQDGENKFKCTISGPLKITATKDHAMHHKLSEIKAEQNRPLSGT